MPTRTCPKCGSEDIAVERKLNGNSICTQCKFKAMTTEFDVPVIYPSVSVKPNEVVVNFGGQTYALNYEEALTLGKKLIRASRRCITHGN